MEMYSKVNTISNFGLNTYIVEVETHIANGLPNFKIVGLPDKSVAEAKERVAAAIKSSGYKFPLKRVIVNLGPAEIPKHGTQFDLAIACSILSSSHQIKIVRNNFLICGELGLNGSIKSNPILSILTKDLDSSSPAIISNKYLGLLPNRKQIFQTQNLRSCCNFLEGKSSSTHPPLIKNVPPPNNKIWNHLQISNSVKRFVTIALGGRHHVNITGIPGCGKTILSQAIAELQPDITELERIEINQIYSLTQYEEPKISPFRSPHHTSTLAAILGGGQIPVPGEISLAHKGILFLDELPLFSSKIINSLRYPLDFRKISISRNLIKTVFPADFQLISAMNPCPCGYLDSKIKKCSCSSANILKYIKRIPEPLWDRIDIHFQLQQENVKSFTKSNKKLKSDEILKDIIRIREKQKKRNLENSKININDLNSVCSLTRDGEKFIEKIQDKMQLSTRGILKVMRVARTISDLENHKNIEVSAIAEAASYRNRKDYLFEN